jgi:hypothetical protein
VIWRAISWPRNGGEVDGQAGLAVRAAVGVVLGREPVKPAAELAELPLDMDLAEADVVALQVDGLTQRLVALDRIIGLIVGRALGPAR